MALLAACADDGASESADAPDATGDDEVGADTTSTGDGTSEGDSGAGADTTSTGEGETTTEAGTSTDESDSSTGEGTSTDEGESSTDEGTTTDEGTSTESEGTSTDEGTSTESEGEESTGGEESTTEEGTTTEEEESTTGEPLTFDNCGFPEDGPWVEIEYWQLGSISSPSYSYSDTPGWGEDEWAYAGHWWPEIWEFGGNSMTNDPIGIVASISGTWQMMIGLEGLSSYDYATVCYEGRSISVGSPATVDVYNPTNGCGVETSISHSWEVHTVGVDLGNCLTPNDETQAVRLEPIGGSGKLGLKRMRLTVHGAVY